MADFPTSIKTFTELVDNVDDVLALHQNERGDEITAIQTYLLSADAPVKLSAASPRIYATTDTEWLKPDNLAYIIVEVVGGGGGSGGVTGASSQAACANGGGGGEYALARIASSDLGSTEAVTVGAGGTAASAGNNDGGTGGTSSFGAHVTAIGGAGGVGQAASATVPRTGSVGGGTGGTGGTGGSIRIPGSAAVPGTCWSTTQVVPSIGGNSHISGTAKSGGAITDDEAGVAGAGYGGGAAGARSSNDANNRAGAAGGNGVVIVWEYIYGVE